MNRLSRYAALLLSLGLCLQAQAEYLQSKLTLTLEGAKRVARAVLLAVVAIVDDGGSLLYLEKRDGTLAQSVQYRSRP